MCSIVGVMPEWPVVDGVELRSVPGYTGYLAGSDGSLWSALAPHKKHRRFGDKWVLKKKWQNVDGYYICHMVDDNGKSHRLLAHTAILLAFVGPRPKGYDALHGDGNPSNNRIENLRWGTRKENMEDARRHGTLAKGEKNGHSKVNNLKVKAITELLASGWTQRDTAMIFEVTQPTISAIANGHRWCDV